MSDPAQHKRSPSVLSPGRRSAWPTIGSRNGSARNSPARASSPSTSSTCCSSCAPRASQGADPDRRAAGSGPAQPTRAQPVGSTPGSARTAGSPRGRGRRSRGRRLPDRIGRRAHRPRPGHPRPGRARDADRQIHGDGANGASADVEPDRAVTVPVDFSPAAVGLVNDCLGTVIQVASLSTTPMCRRSLRQPGARLQSHPTQLPPLPQGF